MIFLTKKSQLMQKIAIPVLEHKLSPHFTTSPLFKIYLVEDQTIVKESLMHLPSQLSESLPAWLAKNGITDVIAINIETNAIKKLNQHKINVFVGVRLETPKVLVQEHIDGTLETSDNLFVK